MGKDLPLYCIVYGLKRHAQFTIRTDGPELVTHAEVALGGFFADPPAMRGRDGEGPHRRWSTAAVLADVRLDVAAEMGVGVLRGTAPWGHDGELAFPALRRLAVKTPEMARLLPDTLRPCPGTRYVEAVVSPLRGGCEEPPVAIDPGGDLTEWQRLGWVSKRTGRRVRVITDPRDVDATLVESLDDRSVRFSRPPRSAPATEVLVDPALVRHVGRASGVIDAQLDGIDDLAQRRPVLADADIAELIAREVLALGPTTISRGYGIPLRTAERIAAGGVPSAQTIARVHAALLAGVGHPTCALDGCVVVVTRANGTYCSRAHRDQGRADGTTVDDIDDTVVRCLGCGTILLGSAATRGTCRSCAGPST